MGEEGAGPRPGPENGAAPDAEAAAARATLEQVCTLLLEPTPEHLDRSAELLAEAIRRLAAWREALPANSARRSARPAEQIRQLRIGLARARRLLEAAAGFHSEWAQCAGALCAGYTGRGQPGVVTHQSHLWAQG